MPALTDAKLEAFTQVLLRNIANGLPRSKAAEAAGREVGYRGSSMAANARKRANRKDVKARMVELAAPKQAEAEAQLAVDLNRAKGRLAEIILAKVPLDDAVMPKDVINALKVLAAIEGWNAPTTLNVNKHVSTDWSTDELVAFLADEESRIGGSAPATGGKTEPDRVH